MALKKGKNVLFNAFIYYTKVKNPALEYQKQAVDSKPHMNRECVVDVLVEEADMKALKKKYKTVKAIKNAREFDAEDFEQTFKVAPPYEAETYYVIKFSKKMYYKDGNEGTKPKIVGVVGQAKDKKGLKVSVDIEVGNGSQAHVQWKERTWDNQFGKGLALDLVALCVLDLVPYVGGGDDLEFDFDEDSDTDFGDEGDFDNDSDAGEAGQSDGGDDSDDGEDW